MVVLEAGVALGEQQPAMRTMQREPHRGSIFMYATGRSEARELARPTAL